MIRFLQHYIFHNAGLKLFSLAMAVLLWAAVSRDPIVEKSLNVPIEFHHIPENLEISSETIPQAQLRVRGPSHQVNDLRPSDLHVELDLSETARRFAILANAAA